MKKIILVLLLFVVSITFAQIENRISYSDEKQKDVIKLQGGTILRFNHIKISDSAWKCNELFVRPNTETSTLQSFITANFSKMELESQSKLFTDFGENVIINNTFNNLNEAYKKIYELEKRIQAVESINDRPDSSF